jgi:hypothetical protein
LYSALIVPVKAAVNARHAASIPVFSEYERKPVRTIPTIRRDRRQASDGAQVREKKG